MQQNEPRQTEISVIIPTYRPEGFLWECLAALDAQTLDHSLFEVILVLNGPREPFMSQIQAFLGAHPGLVCRVLYSPQNGVSLARNRGLDEAQGRYICFIDDDDLVTENYLASLFAIATPDTIALPYICAFDDGSTVMRPIYISEDFIEGGRDIPYVAVRRYFYISCCKLIPCGIIGSRRFDVALRNGEDSQFMLQISDRIRKVCFTDRTVRYMYRQRSGSAFYGNRSVWYHFSNMIVRLAKATGVYLSCPCRYSFRFYITYMLATFMGGIRQMLHKGQ